MSFFFGNNGSVLKRNGTRESELSVWQTFQEPMLRYCDVPGARGLCELRMQHPEDPYLRDIHAHLEREQIRKAVLSGDALHGNPPPAGSLPALRAGRIPLAWLPSGEVLSITSEDVCKNILVVGPTGAGKTNWLRMLLMSVIATKVKT